MKYYQIIFNKNKSQVIKASNRSELIEKINIVNDIQIKTYIGSRILTLKEIK